MTPGSEPAGRQPAAATGPINRAWRIFGTGLAFSVFGIAGVLFGLTVFPLACLPARDRLTARRRAQWIVWRWFHAFSHFMRLLGLITFEVRGAEKLRRPGHLIVANHPTLIDVVLLVAHIPEVTCIVKRAVFLNPFMRWPVSWAEYIGDSTPGQLVEDCAAALRAGRSLLIFPEGTRSVPGQPIRMRHGAARIALEARAPILPVTIRCEPVTLTKGTPWWRVAPRPAHFTITVGEPETIDRFVTGGAAHSIAARRLTRHWEDHFSGRATATPAPQPVRDEADRPLGTHLGA